MHLIKHKGERVCRPSQNPVKEAERAEIAYLTQEFFDRGGAIKEIPTGQFGREFVVNPRRDEHIATLKQFKI